MNLVGKIFVVLIVFMSIVFMSFAVAVYATHRNWRNEVIGENGLTKQLQSEKTLNNELKDDLAKRLAELNAEKEAKKQALAKLENELAVLKENYAVREKNQEELVKSERASVAAMSTAQANSSKSYEELKKLRADIATAQKERDDHFNGVVKLTDQVNQLENEKETLRLRNVDLAKDVGRADQLLRKLGYDKNRDYSEVPPTVDGTILATTGAGLVEISLGSDQGLIEKHQLEVYRKAGGQNTYVGRIEVVKTSPDRAVCKIDAKFQQSNMMVGDRVATKIK